MTDGARERTIAMRKTCINRLLDNSQDYLCDLVRRRTMRLASSGGNARLLRHAILKGNGKLCPHLQGIES
jgi:hypothetical protein